MSMKRMFASLCLTLALLSACSREDKITSTLPSTSVTPTTTFTSAVPVITTVPAITTEPVLTTEPIVTVEPPSVPTPKDEDLVDITMYVPNVRVDLKYSTADNFTKKQIYLFDKAYLRYGTVKKLTNAAKMLEAKGYGIIIWDAYRPTAAQFRLWEICPDPTYVADPNKKFSSHSRGNTVDISLYRLSDGGNVEMPTGFDDFTKKADRDYTDVEKETADRAIMLEDIMKECGFKPYFGEWWHFSDIVSYDVETEFLSNAVTSSDS